MELFVRRAKGCRQNLNGVIKKLLKQIGQLVANRHSLVIT